MGISEISPSSLSKDPALTRMHCALLSIGKQWQLHNHVNRDNIRCAESILTKLVL